MHEYKSNCMHYTSEEAVMQWLEALRLIFQSWEQIMEHLVGGLQLQALGFRSLLSVKDVYLKRSSTRALISCLAAGIPRHSNPFAAPRRYETWALSGRWRKWLPGELNRGYFSGVKWLKQSCEQPLKEPGWLSSKCDVTEYDVRRRKDERETSWGKGREKGLRRWLVMSGGEIRLTFEKGVGGKCLRSTARSEEEWKLL